MEINIDGRGESRSVFLKDIKKRLMCFLNFPENKELLLILIEIIKNIYDHSEGQQGILIINEDPEGINFIVKGFGQGSLFDNSIKPKKKFRNKVNFGIGLKSIKEISKHINLDLEFEDTKDGFIFKGKKYKRL